MFFEERNIGLRQIEQPADAEAPQGVAMVVVPAVTADLTTLEEALQLVQNLHAPTSLDNRESRLYCQPDLQVGLREIGTLKHPSPSTRPTTHCACTGLSC